MPSDWTSNAVGSVEWTAPSLTGPVETRDGCRSDAFSILSNSIFTLREGGVPVSGGEVFSPEYFRALAGALRSSRDPRNARFADAADAAASAPGAPVPLDALRAVLWSWLGSQNDRGEFFYGSPESYALSADTVAPVVGTAPPRAANGQINNSQCVVMGVLRPPTVLGFSPNVLLALGVIGGSWLLISALTSRAPKAKPIGR